MSLLKNSLRAAIHIKRPFKSTTHAKVTDVMENFKLRLKNHIEHVKNVGIHCTTEETTKQALWSCPR